MKTLGLLSSALLLGAVSVDANAGTEVDLELSLVVDNSDSIDTSEFDLQMDGYAAAFRNATVQGKIAAAPKGVAVNLVFFADSAVESIGFTVLTNATQANDFADLLDNVNRPSGTFTNIGAGIELATDIITNNDITSDKQIIDVSADGQQTPLFFFPLPSTARDDALNADIDTINAIVIYTDPQFLTFPITKQYADDNIIGGTGAQTFEANGFDTFEDAVIEKIAFEIDQGTPPTNPIVPTPTAALAGLAMLGALGARRRRRSL